MTMLSKYYVPGLAIEDHSIDVPLDWTGHEPGRAFDGETIKLFYRVVTTPEHVHDDLPLLIFPILAVVTMFISTHISMKASGQEMQGSMKLTMYMMPLMYVFFCFTVPCAFSLYYVISNIVMTVQTQVMRKIYDPEKMKEQVKAETASRKKEEKRGVKSTTIKVQDEKTGEVVEKNISASEMNKRRLEYARQQDAERYKDERTVPLSELQNKKED